MNKFSSYNPVVIILYFLFASIPVFFSMDPFILTISLLGALIISFVFGCFKTPALVFIIMLTFLVSALINPLVSHNGVTVLFVLNDSPITLEACIYGVAASTMIVSVMLWFSSLSKIMTSEKLLYVFGALSPKLSLILSMTFRYIPLFTEQSKKVSNTQRVLGLYKDGNLVDRFMGGLRVFSVMVTWTLENGIISADSMSARGYGTGKRSHFSTFRISANDILLLVLSAFLFVMTMFAQTKTEFAYYPAILLPKPTLTAIMGYISYSFLVLTPAIINLKEALKWKYLRSKISASSTPAAMTMQ